MSVQAEILHEFKPFLEETSRDAAASSEHVSFKSSRVKHKIYGIILLALAFVYNKL